MDYGKKYILEIGMILGERITKKAQGWGKLPPTFA